MMDDFNEKIERQSKHWYYKTKWFWKDNSIYILLTFSVCLWASIVFWVLFG